MKKRFSFGRLGALTLALTLVTTCLMGGTLAKYTSSAAGKATATAAKWAVKLEVDSQTASADFNIALTDTGANASNVAANKVAPGSTGSIPISIDATGTEVDATLSYTIDTSTMTTLPIEFYTTSDFQASSKITSGTAVTKNYVKGATGDDAKFDTTIYWKWVSASDGADTTVGSAGTAQSVAITLKAEQKTN